MLYFNFKNYEEFKERFVSVGENGNKSKSKILLTYYLSKSVFKREMNISRLCDIYPFSYPTNMAQLKNRILRLIYDKTCSIFSHYNCINGFIFWSNTYQVIDEGICEDGDVNSIRYKNLENDRIFKMKAGKFFRKVAFPEESEDLNNLPEQVKIWMQEEFVSQWEAFAESRIRLSDSLTLHVNDDFSAIYDSYRLEGNFHSCMVDKDYHSFYENAVKAKAAYLTNADNMIVARCIIFTEVEDVNTGEILRLAERQYSTDCNLRLQRILISKLIEGGYIDGYKMVGVDCHNARAYVDIHENDMSGRKFSIMCHLDDGDTLSYQDSFKWYDIDKHIAYNYEASGADITLDTTEGEMEGRYYDDYHDYYCHNVVSCYYHGHWLDVDEDNLEDFCFCDNRGDYYHDDDCVWIKRYSAYYPKDECICCEYCEEWVFVDDSCHSEITGYDYCCEGCMEEDEVKYKECYWYWSEFDGKYYEYESEIEEFHSWDENAKQYVKKTIHQDTLDMLIDEKRVIEYENEFYDEWDKETGLPFGVEVKTEALA